MKVTFYLYNSLGIFYIAKDISDHWPKVLLKLETFFPYNLLCLLLKHFSPVFIGFVLKVDRCSLNSFS